MSDDSAILLTIEQRVRSLVAARMQQLRTGYGAHLAVAVREGTDLSGTELLSRAGLSAALVTALAGAQAGALTAIRAGHRAAGTVARTSVERELATQGFQPPEQDRTDSVYLAAVLAGLAAAFATAILDIQNTVRAAFDAVTGTATVVAAARVLTTREALGRAVRRLGVRVTAAATSAVHRGYTDAQNTAYTAYDNTHAYLRVTKRWQVQSVNPCAYCLALHGTVVDIGAEFDRTLGPTDRPHLPVFRDLLGPPRHVNCRCRLVFEVGAAGAQVRDRVTTAAPGPATARMSAADVRRLPADQFRALLSFFAVSARRLRTLIRRAHAGG